MFTLNKSAYLCISHEMENSMQEGVDNLTLSRATKQYCATGAILKLSKQLTLCCQQHMDQLFLVILV